MFHPRDFWEGRFWRKADSLEAQGRRAQADGIAARHPCAGDAVGLQMRNRGWIWHNEELSHDGVTKLRRLLP